MLWLEMAGRSDCKVFEGQNWLIWECGQQGHRLLCLDRRNVRAGEGQADLLKHMCTSGLCGSSLLLLCAVKANCSASWWCYLFGEAQRFQAVHSVLDTSWLWGVVLYVILTGLDGRCSGKAPGLFWFL